MKTAIGLMSGTSLDGIDAALIETDGAAHVTRRFQLSTPYPAAFRQDLAAALRDARGMTDRDARPGCLRAVEAALTTRHAAAVHDLLHQTGLSPANVDIIGFHGQTVWHDTSGPNITVQIGDGKALSAATGIAVAYDMRANDVASGGTGAPLVPIYHHALANTLPQRPLAFVNVGGVANVTWIGGPGHMLAFDTGPGGALLDDFMARATNGVFDEDGMFAARGRVNEDLLADLMRHRYFHLTPPKTLDRNAFDTACLGSLSDVDHAATLTAFTAESIARSVAFMPREPALWIVCGGGRRNRTFMRMLAERVENAIAPAEAVGLDGDAMEAEAWAYLAVRAQAGLPLTFPLTTGVSAPMTGGIVVSPDGTSML